jgi:UDP-glucuronate 4-epimerase
VNILVTGAAGFIGSHLAERLLASGHSVVGLDSFDTFYDPAIKERNLDEARSWRRFQEVRGDIRDPDTYDRVPDEVEAVIHLAARAGVRPSIADPMLYMDVNVNGTTRLLEFIREREIPTLLFGSSSSVYGDSAPVPLCEDDPADRPISPYAATKRAGELLVHSHCHLYGLGALCLRFFTVFGPRQRPDLAIHKFAGMLRDGEVIPMFGDGSSERDYTEVEDILDGIEGALEYLLQSPGTYDIVNLGGGRTITLRQMIDEIGDAMGVQPRVRRLPDQPGDVRRTFADLSKAHRLLGYRPSVPFDEGIRRFASWFVADRGASQLVGSP